MKIGLIIAMDKEFSDLLSLLSDVTARPDGVPFAYYTAKYKQIEVVAVKSGIGEIAAAAATQFLITSFGVETVINMGICGALNANFKKLDLAVVDKIVHYQFDTSAVDPVKVGQYPDCADRFLVTDRTLFELIKSIDGEVKPAICASADLFVAKKQDKDYLAREFGADVCEMESAGILLTCKRSGVPCAFLKSVSDDADGGYFEEFCKKASERHVALLIKLLDRLQ